MQKWLRRGRWIGLFLAVVTTYAFASEKKMPLTSAEREACKEASIRIEKSKSSLILQCNGNVIRKFSATFGASPKGQKEREGDERTPEGEYRIASKRIHERFHRFMLLDYPNAHDRKRASANGISEPGGAIGIHGVAPKLAPLARLWIDIARPLGFGSVWGPTDGCIGLKNEDVEVVYEVAKAGTLVTIVP